MASHRFSETDSWISGITLGSHKYDSHRACVCVTTRSRCRERTLCQTCTIQFCRPHESQAADQLERRCLCAHCTASSSRRLCPSMPRVQPSQARPFWTLPPIAMRRVHASLFKYRRAGGHAGMPERQRTGCGYNKHKDSLFRSALAYTALRSQRSAARRPEASC